MKTEGRVVELLLSYQSCVLWIGKKSSEITEHSCITTSALTWKCCFYMYERLFESCDFIEDCTRNLVTAQVAMVGISSFNCINVLLFSSIH